MIKYLIATLALIVAISFFVFSPPRTESEPIFPCTKCNVIIVGLDAWQAAHMHFLGYERDTTQTLDALAKRGYVFSNAISASSWTVPSFMSIFTGTFPSVHKLVNKFVTYTKTNQQLSNLNTLAPDVVTLAETFRDAGYKTAGFTGDAGVAGKFGYNQGFDTYLDETKFGGFKQHLDATLAWTGERAKKHEPFFLFYHGYDAHGQFQVAANYKSRYEPSDYTGPFRGTPQEQEALRERGLSGEKLPVMKEDIAFWRAWYDGKIRDADDVLRQFFDGLEAQGLLKNSIIILVSDHGTEFFEHGRVDHGHTLYDELVHVPLVILAPGEKGGRVIPQQVSTIDIAPTVFDALGLSRDSAFGKQLRGTSLLPFLSATGTVPTEDAYIETDYRNLMHLRGIRTTDNKKYVLNLQMRTEELYDLNRDPHELHNIATSSPALAKTLREKVMAHVQAMGGVPHFSNDCLPVYDSQCR